MSCCGNQRTQLFHPSSNPVGKISAAAPAHQPVVRFEYIGRSGLTVIGGATGRRYRFEQPGARVVVDPRDRPSLAAVPSLRQA